MQVIVYPGSPVQADNEVMHLQQSITHPHLIPAHYVVGGIL